MRQLNEAILGKIDLELQRKLSQQEEDSDIKVILTLKDQVSSQVTLSEQVAVKPENFSSREEYRKALISQQRERVSSEIKNTLKELDKLSIPYTGGQASNNVIVSGNITQIEQALSLPGVIFGSLDQQIKNGNQEKQAMIKRLSQVMVEIIRGYSLDSQTKKPLEPQEAPMIKQRIHNAARKFIDTYEKEFGNLRVIGVPDTKPLNAIYTSADMDEVSEPQVPPSSKNILTTFKQRKPYKANRPVSGKDFCQGYNHVIVLGQAGSGKSVFLKKIALDTLRADQRNADYKIPVLIELKSFSAGEVDFPKEIEKSFRSYGVPLADEFTKFALKSGRLMILLDGLDEVPDRNFPSMKDSINHLIKNHSTNKFIISCRLAAVSEIEEIEGLRSFKRIRIADFDKEKIGNFIDKWFSGTKDTDERNAEKCKKLLFKPENSNARDLARTPLFLTFLCLIYDHYGTFPDNRSFLYRQALNILLKEWSAGKQSASQQAFCKLDVYLEETFLSEIAYENFSSQRLYFTKTELTERIHAFLDNNYNAPKFLTCDSLLKEMITHQGILVEYKVIDQEPIYFFSHLTLQEYLVAKYVNDCGLVRKTTEVHFGNKNWRSIFPLISGLMLCGSGADELILCMSNEIHKFISTRKLDSLITWAYQKCNVSSDSDQTFLVRRTLLLVSILDYLALQTKDKDKYILRNLNFSIYWSQRWSYKDELPKDFEIAKNIIAILAIARRLINYRSTSDQSSNSEIKKVLKRTLEMVKSLKKEIRKDRVQFTQQVMQHLHRRASVPAQKKVLVSVFPDSSVDTLEAKLEELVEMVPSRGESEEAFEKFIVRLFDDVKKICIDLFKLSEDLLTISEEESALVERYFYVNHLLDYCIRAASRLSYGAVEQAKKKMLAPVTAL